MQSPGNPPEQVNPDGSQWSDDASESLDPAKSPIWVNPRKSMGQRSPQWAISLLQQSNPLIAAYPHARERLKKRHPILALASSHPLLKTARTNKQQSTCAWRTTRMTRLKKTALLTMMISSLTLTALSEWGWRWIVIQRSGRQSGPVAGPTCGGRLF